MSVENTESILHGNDSARAFFSTVISWIPKAWIPTLLSLYIWFCDTWDVTLQQTIRTKQAVLQSFESSPLLFLHGTHFVGVKASGTLDPVSARKEAVWSYDPQTHTFTEQGCDELRPKRVPWLSAELVEEGLMVSDLTDWLEKIRIQSEQSVCPAEVLIQAWAYTHNRFLGNLSRYQIQLMNEDAEEQTIPVRTI